MAIGDRIKKARKAKGITQQELADKLGYKSRSSINKLEKEARDIPRSQIVKLAEILDVTPAYLMGWEEFDEKFDTKQTIADRLNQIMSERNLKQVDILELCQPYCKKFNVKLNKNDLSQYVSGKVVPKQDKLSILSMALDVNEVWLMGYNLPFEMIKNPYRIETEKMLNLFIQLDEIDRLRVIERIETMLEDDKYSRKGDVL